MTRIFNADPQIIALLALWGLLLINFIETILIRSFTLIKGKRFTVISAGLLAVTVVNLLIFDDALDFQIGSHVLLPFSSEITLGAVLAAFLLISGGTFVLYRYTNSAFRHSVTGDSIREAIDALPDGVQYSGENGETFLVNRRMLSLNKQLLRSGTANTNENYRRMERGELYGDAKLLVKKENSLTIQLETGEVVRISRRVQSDVIETTALNITEQYELNQELSARKRQLSDVNRRLRRFSAEIADVTREQEILAAKIQVHNDFARTLLATRAYISPENSDINRNELITLWRRSIEALEGGVEEEEKPDELEEMKKAASAVNVKLKITGSSFPDGGLEHDTIIDAIHESLNNMVKHSDGKTLHVDIRNRVYTIISDGTPPAAPIEEKGGLINLREEVEKNGGVMQIEWQPVMKLIIDFSMEKGQT